MRIRETTTLTADTRGERSAVIVEGITELEQQHEAGVIETSAYLNKRRALVGML